MTFALPALLILQLPFEWRTSLFHLGNIHVTNLECTAAFVLIALGIRRLRIDLGFDGLDWAATAWVAAWALAGLVAPAEYPAALKMAARMAVGPVLCIILRGTVGAASARLGRVFALTGAAAAVLGIMDVCWPTAVAPLLSGFREKGTVSSFGVRAAGPFEHANQFSCFIELTIPFALLIAADRNAQIRRLGWALGAIGLVGVVLGLSRSGWLAVLVAAGATIRSARRTLGGRRAMGLALGLVAVMALPFALSSRLRGRMLWPHRAPPFAASYAFSSTPTPRVIVMNHGTETWQAAWTAFREHPWVGIGPGRFQETYARWLPQAEPDPRLHPNNMYLHTLAEGGAVAMAALLMLISFAGAALWRGLTTPRTAVLAAAGIGMLTGWLVHGVLDSFLLFNGCAYAFWIGLALATPKREPSPARQRLHRT